METKNETKYEIDLEIHDRNSKSFEILKVLQNAKSKNIIVFENWLISFYGKRRIMGLLKEGILEREILYSPPLITIAITNKGVRYLKTKV